MALKADVRARGVAMLQNRSKSIEKYQAEASESRLSFGVIELSRLLVCHVPFGLSFGATCHTVDGATRAKACGRSNRVLRR